MENGAIGLLRARHTFRLYLGGRVLSLIGDGVALIALMLYVQSATGTGLSVAGMLLARSLPRLLGPLGGAVADRLDQRRVMLACDIAQGLLYGIIAIALPSYPVLLVLIAITSVFQTLFQTAGQAAVPRMVDAEELLHANAWLGTATNLQVAAGPVIGGALVSLAGTRLALGVNAASFLASAICVVQLPTLGAALRETTQGLFADTREGLAFVWRDPAARSLSLLVLGCSAFLAVDTVALVFLVRDSLHGSSAAYGVSASAFGLGMVAASAGLLARIPQRSPAILLVAALLVGAVGTAATGLAASLALAITFQVITGVGNGLENIATDTLVQSRFPPPMVGRVYGVVSTASYAATSLSLVVAGVAVDVAGPRDVFIGAGVGAALVLGFLSPSVLREPRRDQDRLGDM